MPGETEFSRLVVRMVGDPTGYQKMMTDARKWTSDLTSSIGKDLTQAQDKHTASVQRGNAEVAKSAGILRTFSNEVKTTAGAIYEAALPGKSIFGKVGSIFSAETYTVGIKKGFEGFRRELATIQVQEGDLTRFITARQAEFEALQASRIKEGMGLAQQQREHERSLAREDRGDIDNSFERKVAMQEALNAAIKEENALRQSNTGTTGGGIRQRLNEADSQWFQKAISATKAAITGGNDEHAETMKRLQEEYEYKLKGEKEIAGVRRELEREMESFERSRKKALDDLMKSSKKAFEEDGMSDEEKIAKRAREAGASSSQVKLLISRHRFGVDRDRRAATDQSVEAQMRGLQDNLTAPDVERGSGDFDQFAKRRQRARRDKKMQDDLVERHATQLEINRVMRTQHEVDEKEDKEDRSDKIERIVESLNRQAQSYERNTDVLFKYRDALKDVSEEEEARVERAAMDAEVKRLERENQDDLENDKRDRIREGNRIRENLKSPAQKKADEIKHLKMLMDDGAISADEYAKAVKKLDEVLDKGGRSYGGSEHAAAYGSAEALNRLEDFYGSFERAGEHAGGGQVTRGGGGGKVHVLREPKSRPHTFVEKGAGGGHATVWVEMAKDLSKIAKSNEQMAEKEANNITIQAAGFSR